MAETLLSVSLSRRRNLSTEERKNEMSGQFSVFHVWLDALKWTEKKNSEHFNL